eukprot:m.42481 g.42481  ORF g.42481 m.42481 type:complete len:662 (-) comp9885_c0_seq1:32-2017(-)
MAPDTVLNNLSKTVEEDYNAVFFDKKPASSFDWIETIPPTLTQFLLRYTIDDQTQDLALGMPKGFVKAYLFQFFYSLGFGFGPFLAVRFMYRFFINEQLSSQDIFDDNSFYYILALMIVEPLLFILSQKGMWELELTWVGTLQRGVIGSSFLASATDKSALEYSNLLRAYENIYGRIHTIIRASIDVLLHGTLGFMSIIFMSVHIPWYIGLLLPVPLILETFILLTLQKKVHLDRHAKLEILNEYIRTDLALVAEKFNTVLACDRVNFEYQTCVKHLTLFKENVYKIFYPLISRHTILCFLAGFGFVSISYGLIPIALAGLRQKLRESSDVQDIWILTVYIILMSSSAMGIGVQLASVNESLNVLQTEYGILKKKVETIKESTKKQNIQSNSEKHTRESWVQNMAKMKQERPLVSCENLSWVMCDISIIDDITAKIYPGDRIALVGATGAGKTSLVGLLAGLKKRTEGQIYVDMDVSIVHVPALNEACIWQHKTARYNVLYDNHGGVPDHEITNLLTKLDLSFAKELDTLLDRKILSSGEVQRVLLARAILSKKNVLILDEGMQALNNEMEETVWDILDTTFDVILSISHKWLTVRRCEKAWVMNQGKIVEEGDTQALAKNQNSLMHHLFWDELKTRASFDNTQSIEFENSESSYLQFSEL